MTAESFANAEVIDHEPRLHRWEKRTEWPLAGVAGIFLAVYSVQVLAKLPSWLNDILEAGLVLTYSMFVIDYLVRLRLATNRVRWFFRHLLDLAVVVLPLLRPLRLLRLLVLFSALQRAVGGAFRGRIVVYTAFSVILLVYVASLAILDVERGRDGSTINNFGDAVWWSITTITTVGYGDLSPVTTAGKVIAVFLMVGGISLVGLVTATLASWIIQRVAEEDSASCAVTTAHIEDLRTDMQHRIDLLTDEVHRLNEADRQRVPGGPATPTPG